MNEYKTIVDVVLEFLKDKELLTQLDKDILSTNQLYMESPIDRMKMEQKLVELDCRYEDIAANLYVRLVAVCVKEQQELRNDGCIIK